MEIYIRDLSEAEFTHGLCPQCADTALHEIKRLNTNRSST